MKDKKSIDLKPITFSIFHVHCLLFSIITSKKCSYEENDRIIIRNRLWASSSDKYHYI